MKHQTRKKKLPISLEEFHKVMGDDWEFFQEKIVHNVRCIHCDSSYNSTIVDYFVEINDLNDSILRGKCRDCGNPVNRYLETGENPKQVKVIEELRKSNKRL